MKYGTMENGIAKKANGRHKKRRRRRNTTTTSKAAPRRRNISLASAKSVLKRNGLKAVSKSANPRHKRRKHRRNGLAKVPRRSNGFFGDTRGEVTTVVEIGSGLIGTKMVGGALSGFAQNFLTSVGLGKYAGVFSDLGVAVFIAPWVANKIKRGSGKMVRIGGLLATGFDALEIFAPGLVSYNPFNTAPIVMTGSGAAIAPAAVAQIAADVENGNTSAAKVAGVMAALDTAGAQGTSNAYAGQYATAPELVL